MKRFVWGLGVAVMVAVSGCSLHQVKYRTLPPEPSRTILVHENQALDWGVVSSYYASDQVVLNYPLCPRQHLIGKPVIRYSQRGVAITLWANPTTCANPTTHLVTVQLGQNLGHRPLTNPSLY